MKKCRIEMVHWYGGDPKKMSLLMYSDVVKFFVKVMYKQPAWEIIFDALSDDINYNAFDAEDLKLGEVQQGCPATVEFTCADWVLRKLQDRYEIEEITIDDVRYIRSWSKSLEKWIYVTDESYPRPLFS